MIGLQDKPRDEGFEGESVQGVAQLKVDGSNLSNDVAIGKKFGLLAIVKFPGKIVVLKRVSHCNSFRMNRMSGEILSLWKYPANYTAAASHCVWTFKGCGETLDWRGGEWPDTDTGGGRS